MKGNLAGLMQQAQKMQQEIQKAQEELANMTVTGEAGGGLVKVTMTGKHAVRRVEIDPSERMSDMTSGIPLPPGMKLPF